MTQKVEFKKTELHSISSKINFHDYDLYISLPKLYAQKSITDRYDVLYILNAQWDFGLMLSIYGSAYFDQFLPGIILVGIGWSGQESDDEAGEYGMKDFSDSVLQGIPHNGATLFLEVLENEIIPYVERNFAVNSNRCLSGSSIAAWFGLFAMVKKPSLFNKYVLSSPPTWFSNDLIFQYESIFSNLSNQINASLYVSYGELEDSESMKNFLNILINRNYENLNIKFEEIKYTGHATNKPIGYTKGLLNVYNKLS